jgi:hypothetical protein
MEERLEALEDQDNGAERAEPRTRDIGGRQDRDEGRDDDLTHLERIKEALVVEGTSRRTRRSGLRDTAKPANPQASEQPARPTRLRFPYPKRRLGSNYR